MVKSSGGRNIFRAFSIPPTCVPWEGGHLISGAEFAEGVKQLHGARGWHIPTTSHGHRGQRVCSNYHWMALVRLLCKVYTLLSSWLLKEEDQYAFVQFPQLLDKTSSLPSLRFCIAQWVWPTSPHVLWILRRLTALRHIETMESMASCWWPSNPGANGVILVNIAVRKSDPFPVGVCCF